MENIGFDHFHRFWIDSGPILDGVWTALGSIFDRFWVDFGGQVGTKLASKSSKDRFNNQSKKIYHVRSPQNRLSVDLDLALEIDDTVWRNSAVSIYKRFNQPDYISYVNIYKVSLDNQDYKYLLTMSYLSGNPNVGRNGSHNPQVDSISDLFDVIEDGIKRLTGDNKEIGLVSEINDDIILVTLTNINVRNNMELTGTSIYNFGPEKGGYKHRLEDLKNAIAYMRASSSLAAFHKIQNLYKSLHNEDYRTVIEKINFYIEKMKILRKKKFFDFFKKIFHLKKNIVFSKKYHIDPKFSKDSKNGT